jgi:hypothetical protein
MSLDKVLIFGFSLPAFQPEKVSKISLLAHHTTL